MMGGSYPATRLGPYEVGAKIGGGGMASVYIGRRADSGGEALVALKVIKDELAQNPTFIHMFLDEAKVLSQLSHPNILETLDYGVTDDARFIAMELLFGHSLADVWDALAAKSQRVPVVLGAWICARVADGLQHAHALKDEEGQPLGVIHRDVNPTNIFLTFDGRVKLIDFGLAKMKNRRAKTGEGIVKGKVPYLSPEQILQSEIDARSDQYSLGTSLWELGAGKRLFKRDSDIATIDAIRQGVVPDLRDVAPGYPDALWSAVKRALSTKPEDRFATAGDMARALDDWVAEQAPAESGSQALRAFLAEMFTGEQERQTEWLRVASVRSPMHKETLPPPMPLPEISSDPRTKVVVPAGASSSPAPTPPSAPDGTPAPPRGEADRRFWVYASIIFLGLYVVAALATR